MAFSTSTMVPTSISQAINFLTRPLILSQESDMIHSLQMILRSTLQAVYSAARSSRLVLSLSVSSLPPRPIYAACIASGLQWCEWIALLGSRDFDLVIEPHTVSVNYVGPNPQTIILWSEPLSTPVKRPLLSRPNFHNLHVPISKLGQQSLMQASLKATIGSAQARANTRTLAQQLLESDHKQEADEIFAMISKTAIISPTPTREKFSIDIPINAFPSPLSSPELLSPATSRPSSRSSTFSALSFSDTESITSASSTSSTSDLFSSTKPRNTTTFVPRPTRVFINNDKKDVTKYLYQGGVSTVLTGGVMLGGPAAAKNRVAKATSQNSSSASSWRRTARV
ncbi:hypothetical protein BYT27DRAFT_7181770 [Phlegmacium glaucopus]|nr:hypothetical protein BYT27DRAFT_7181770 [Phlegmacium glaucopus]